MIHRLLIGLIYFIILGSLLADENVSVQLRGIAQLSGKYIFSVLNTETNQFKWVKFNQEFGKLIITGYNSTDLSIEGLYNNKPISIKLGTSGHKPKNINNMHPEKETIRLSETEIERMTNNFKEKELAKLPDEHSPLYKTLKQSAENKISVYELSLINRNQEIGKPEQKNQSNPKPRIGTKRK